MLFPKIIILAQGGTHGDFLYESCQLMILNNNNINNKIDNNGRVLESSIFKRKNFKLYKKGQKKGLMFDHLNDAKSIEICHIWYEEFINWPSKFYYINFDDSLIDIIKQMYFEKVCNNDKNKAMEDYKKYLPNSISKKITLDNFDKIITMSYKSIKRKYRLQPNIKEINMLDLYSLDKLIDILKNMAIYNEKKLLSLKKLHNDWLKKNSKWIKQLKNS
jgi:hypothetical protein